MLNQFDRFVFAKLVDLKAMLRQGDTPACKGICGFIRLNYANMGEQNKGKIEDAICLMKDIMSDWPDASNSWEYPVPANIDQFDTDDAEHAFEYLDEQEHWTDTDYSNMRRNLLDFTINKYIEIIANEKSN